MIRHGVKGVKYEASSVVLGCTSMFPKTSLKEACS